MKIHFRLFAVVVTLLFSPWVKSNVHLCFVTGHGAAQSNLNPLKVNMVNTLASQGITMNVFVPDEGLNDPTIQQMAQNLAYKLSNFIAQNPNTKCLFLVHSQGGIVLRYLMNHLDLRDPINGQVPAWQFVSQAMVFGFGVPHDGFSAADDFASSSTAMSQMGPLGIQEFNDPVSASYCPIHPQVIWWHVGLYINDVSQASNFLESYYFQQFASMSPPVANDGFVELDTQVSYPGALTTSYLNISHSSPTQNTAMAQIYGAIHQFFSPLF